MNTENQPDLQKAAESLQWLDRFVEEPGYFPGAGDRQWWIEKRDSIRSFARALSVEAREGSDATGAQTLGEKEA